jgi:hypothetical protein
LTRSPRASSATAPGWAGGRSTWSRTSRPTISSASSAAVVSDVVRVPTVLPAPDDGDPVADRGDLAQLVGDEDDRPAAGPEPPQDAVELLDLLRRQQRRRLVQDQRLPPW